jgi:hypothetical protein
VESIAHLDQPEQDKIYELLRPLTETKELLKQLKNDPLDTSIIEKIQTLISNVNIDELVQLENPDPKNNLLQDISLRERLDFISRYVQQGLAPKKIEVSSQSSQGSSILQVFKTIFSSPFLRYGLPTLTVVFIAYRYMKLSRLIKA